jgi:hypothetical protein
VRVHKNVLRVPVLTDRSEVTSIRFGEPDGALFVIPPGYREIADPHAEGLRRFVDRNRSRVSAPPR